MKNSEKSRISWLAKFAIVSTVFAPALIIASTIVTSVSINGVNFPGGSAVTVSPGNSLSIKVTGLNSVSSDRWLYTKVYITKNGSQNGSTQCIDTTNITTTGSKSVTFNYTVPSNVTSGASQLNVQPFSNSTCTQSSGPSYRALNSLNVNVPTPPPAPLPITISPTSLAKPVIGGNSSYSQTLTATTQAVGPFTWSISSGSLPPGLSLGNSTTKTVSISGNPNTSGTFNFSVRITNGLSSTTAAYTLTIDPVVPTPDPTSANLILNPKLQNATINPSIPDFWHLGGWNAVFESLYPAPGPNIGDKAAKVTVTSATGGFADWFSDAVPVTPLTEYHFSDSYMSTAPTIIEAQYSITGVPGFFYTDVATLPSSGGLWKQSNVTFVTPVGASSLTIFHLLNTVGTLSITNTSLVRNSNPTNFGKGMVSIVFDDGLHSQYDRAFPILKAANLPATFYIISQSMLDANEDSPKQFMDVNEILELRKSGNEIGDHTVYHCDLATGLCPDGEVPNSKDPLTVFQEINQARITLTNSGLGPIDTLAYPYGSYNQTTIANAQSAGLLAARSVERGYNIPTSDRYNLKVQYVNATMLNSADFASTIKPWIDGAVQNNAWVILLFHAIEPASVISQTNDPDATTPEVLQSTINYLKQNNISTVTVRDGVCKMAGMASDSRCK